MRVIKLTLEYDGTGLSGWQRQDNAPSVQEHLEDALASMVRAPVRVHGASRTDAGVHALGQVAHFSTAASIPCHGFRRGLNGILPPSIAVVDAAEAEPDFHARFKARGKHYRYAMVTRAERSPLWRTRAWHRPRSMDIAAMERAATHLVGERDFGALRASGCTAKTTVRAVHAVDIERPNSDSLLVDVRGNAFLRNMVRIMVGTLVAVGEGRIQADEIPAILDSCDRGRAGQTAPAHGLTLVRVFY